MMDSPHANDSSEPTGSKSPNENGRTPGVGKADMRDVVAELTERAQVISREAGGRIASAMRDVIGTGAGIAGFAIESARDLVQFMVRRGQMTPEEGDKLLRDVEATHRKRSPAKTSTAKTPVVKTPVAKAPPVKASTTASKTTTKSPAKAPAKASAKVAAKSPAKSATPAAKGKPSTKSTPAKKKK